MTNIVFDELMTIAGHTTALDEQVRIVGHDPVLPTRFQIGEMAAGIHAACGVAVADQSNNQDDSQTCLVVLNMSQRAHRLSFSLAAHTGHVLFSSHNRDRDTDDLSKLYIAPFEVYIAELR